MSEIQIFWLVDHELSKSWLLIFYFVFIHNKCDANFDDLNFINLRIFILKV